MKQKAKILLRSSSHVTALLALASALSATIVPRPGSENVPQLFASASLVFKGKVEAVTKSGMPEQNTNGQATAERFTAAVRVDHVFKGELAVNETVYINFDRPTGTYCNVAPCISFAVDEYDLFFLTERNHSFELLDRYFGKFPVSMISAAAPVKGLAGLESDLAAGLSDSNERRLLTNIELLGAMQKIASTNPLKRLMNSPEPVIKAAALAALLHLHDYQYLSEARASMETTASDATLPMLQDRISLYVEDIRDPTTIPVLIYLAGSHSDLLRQAAIHALRETPSTQVVPLFVAALDDPVQLIRYDAVLGLATLEKNWDLAPSVDTFKHSESKYITAWKVWWAESGQGQNVAPAPNPQRGGEANN